MILLDVSTFVALFTRAWIEIVDRTSPVEVMMKVALFTRAWIEIRNLVKSTKVILVALFTRAWIEM